MTIQCALTTAPDRADGRSLADSIADLVTSCAASVAATFTCAWVMFLLGAVFWFKVVLV